MPTKTSKSPATEHNPMESEINVQDTPKPRAGTPATPIRDLSKSITLNQDPFALTEKTLTDHLEKIAELKTKAASNVGHKSSIHENVFVTMYATIQKALQAAQAAHQAYENLKARHEETETRLHMESDNDHRCSCNKKLDEIKEAVDALAKTRTYADAAAGRLKTDAALAKKERIGKAKLEQMKKVVTISFRDATETMKERLKTMNSQELTQLIKDHIPVTLSVRTSFHAR